MIRLIYVYYLLYVHPERDERGLMEEIGIDCHGHGPTYYFFTNVMCEYKTTTATILLLPTTTLLLQKENGANYQTQKS